MSHSTIRKIRAVMRLNGLRDAVTLARFYGINDPASFVLFIIAEPGQRVKVR